MNLSRRTFLRGATALPLLGALGACGDDAEPHVIFVHGVASGDPTPTALIIWTRVSTAAPGTRVDVRWEISADDFATIAQSGTLTTDDGRDFTVKHDVTGLTPGTTYHYRFTALGETSDVGHARLPPAGALTGARLGVVSCSSYAHGYFTAYRHLAAQDVDAVIHLGDYIYEYGDGEYGDVRTYQPPHEAVTLADYRVRYGHYRSDPDLQAVHAAHPFIVVWDDHELCDDTWRGGGENHDPATEGTFEARRAAAAQAYREWMPIRDQPDGRIWRKLGFGDLVDVFMLDTRLWGRDQQSDLGGPPLEDPARTLLGADQEAWLAAELPASTAAWKLVGQQVMMGQLPQFLNRDAWDGYPAARTRFFDLIETEAVRDVVVLTGDIHTSWAMDLTRTPQDVATYDPATGFGSLAVELVTPPISSPGLSQGLSDGVLNLVRENRHLKYADVYRPGFLLLDVTRARVRAEFHHYEDVLEPERPEPTISATLEVRAGVPALVKL